MLFELMSTLLAIKHSHGERDLKPSEITKLVRRAINDPILIVRTERSLRIDPNQIIPAGEYDSTSDDEDCPAIEISLLYHQEQSTFRLNDCEWERVSFEIAECIGHEYVHREQYYSGRCSDHSYQGGTPDQVYLGNSDEIEAYGYSIAAELAAHHMGKLGAREQVFMYQHYAATFPDDQSVMLSLNDNISKYLKQLGDEKCQNNKYKLSSKKHKKTT